MKGAGVLGKRHILLLGERGAGKTTLTQRLLRHNTRPLGGFITRSDAPEPDGFRPVYLHPAADLWNPSEKRALVGRGNGITKESFPEAFETFGLECLRSAPDSLILMDELGTMEREASFFQQAVLHCLDGNNPVLATIKTKEVAFLEAVKNHPNAAVYRITEENRDALFEELLPYILRWNKEL